MINKSRRTTIDEIISQRKNIVIVFLLFLVGHMHYTIFPNSYAYTNTYYVYGYELGFVARGLLGQLFLSISPYITNRQLVLFKFFFLVGVYLVLAIILCLVVSKQDNKRSQYYFMLMPLCLPFTFQFALDDIRHDLYLILLLVCVAILVVKNKFISVIPFLVIIMILFSETAILCVVPQVIMILIYKLIKQKDKDTIIALIITIIFSVWLGVYFLFVCTNKNSQDLASIQKYLVLHTDAKISIDAIAGSYGMTLKDHVNFNLKRITTNPLRVLVFIISIVPLVYFFINIYKSGMQKVYCKLGERKYVYILGLMGISCITPITSCIMSIDYPRYVAFSLISLLIIIYMVMATEGIQLNVEEINQEISRKIKIPGYLYIILLFYLFYGTFGASLGSTKFVRSIENIFLYIFK